MCADAPVAGSAPDEHVTTASPNVKLRVLRARQDDLKAVLADHHAQNAVEQGAAGYSTTAIIGKANMDTAREYGEVSQAERVWQPGKRRSLESVRPGGHWRLKSSSVPSHGFCMAASIVYLSTQ